MFKHSNYFDFKIKGSRSENCILIDVDNWVVNTSNMIVGVNSRGGIANSYITEVLATNIGDSNVHAEDVKAGDFVLLTSVATRMYCSRTFQLPIDFDSTKYTEIPLAHIIGVFGSKNNLSLTSLKILNSYIILDRVSGVDKVNNLVVSTEGTKSVYKVLRCPENNKVKEGDTVLVRDNSTTELMLNGKEYSFTTLDMVIGKFDGDIAIKNLTPLNNFIVMTDYQSGMAEGSNIILNPEYDVTTDVDQYSEVYKEDQFKVLKSDCDNVFEEDVVRIIREATDYCTFRGIKYFVVSGSKFIEAKIK